MSEGDLTGDAALHAAFWFRYAWLSPLVCVAAFAGRSLADASALGHDGGGADARHDAHSGSIGEQTLSEPAKITIQLSLADPAIASPKLFVPTLEQPLRLDTIRWAPRLRRAQDRVNIIPRGNSA